ncbi:MAG: HmuY family protein [Rubricoccaceae bacterium]|nr:HmuY family protein [Rubricoccaceae bacterium]
MRSTALALALIFGLAWTATPASGQSLIKVEDLEAIGTGMGAPSGPFTLYSLKDSRVVVGMDDAERADSASTAWDIGFRGTTIIINGGTSGPGNGAAALVSSPFGEVTSVPEASLFLTDGENECPREDKYAICTGSGNGWYSYGGSGVIDPLPDQTIIVRLADGGYAKMRIIRYQMSNEDGSGPRLYTFEYELLSGK